MTKTVQTRSLTQFSVTNRAKDTVNIPRFVFDRIINLHDVLRELEYEIEKMQQIILNIGERK